MAKPQKPKVQTVTAKKGPPTLSQDKAENFRVFTESKLKKIERLILSIGDLTTGRHQSTPAQHEEIRQRITAMAESMVKKLQTPPKEKLPRGIRPDAMTEETLRLSLKRIQDELEKREKAKAGVKS